MNTSEDDKDYVIRISIAFLYIYGGQWEVGCSGSELSFYGATIERDILDYNIQAEIATRGVCEHFRGLK